MKERVWWFERLAVQQAVEDFAAVFNYEIPRKSVNRRRFVAAVLLPQLRHGDFISDISPADGGGIRVRLWTGETVEVSRNYFRNETQAVLSMVAQCGLSGDVFID